MIADTEPELLELKYISLNEEYTEQEILLAYNTQTKNCWYVDENTGNLVPLDYTKFFDNSGKLIL